MGFAVVLAQDVVQVEPGATVPFSISIENQSAESDRFELEIEGIDGDWKAVPEPIFTVEPGQTLVEKIFFKPPRASESLYGTYPFVVRVRSLESGEVRTAKGVLEVLAYHHISVEINPKKGYYSPFTKQNDFDVAIMNLSNVEHMVQLTGTDPEDACTFEFESDQITVGPGQERMVPCVVKPKRTSLVSSGNLIGFSVSARAVDHRNVAASGQAQLEQRAFFTPAALILFVLAAIIGLAWWINMPKPPAVSLKVDKVQVVRGDTVNIAWEAEAGSRVRLASQDGTIEISDLPASGTQSFAVQATDSLSLFVEATRKGLKARSETVRITVSEPEMVPDPAIVKFAPDRKRVKLGTSFFLEYDFNEATVEAILSDGRTLDTSLSRLEITPKQAGQITYEVSARNKVGKAVVGKFTIEVFEESDAAILAFSADKLTARPDDNVVRISWQATRSARVELKESTGSVFVVSPQDTRDFLISQKTTFTLTAYDESGRKVFRQLTVEYEEPVAPPDLGPTDGGEPGGGPPPTTIGGSPPPTNATPDGR